MIGSTALMAAAEEPRQKSKTWRVSQDIWLEQQPPHRDELERWETGACGPHPCPVRLVKISETQWGSSFDDGLMVYDSDATVALELARHYAIDRHQRTICRLQQIVIWE